MVARGLAHYATVNTGLRVFYAFGGGVSGAAMRLTGVWSETSDTREAAESSSPADAVRLNASVSPHEVIAWQHTTVDESHDLCCCWLAGNSCCAPACWVIVIDIDADGA